MNNNENNNNNSDNNNNNHSNNDSQVMTQVLAVGEFEMLFCNYADCNKKTGGFCDHCLAENRFPDEVWAPGQMTPLCHVCNNKHGALHFCLGKSWAVPPPSGPDRPRALD